MCICTLTLHIKYLHSSEAGKARRTGIWRGDDINVETIVSFMRVRKWKKGEGGCHCVIDSPVELPHCAASVDFPLLRVYSQSVVGTNDER